MNMAVLAVIGIFALISRAGYLEYKKTDSYKNRSRRRGKWYAGLVP